MDAAQITDINGMQGQPAAQSPLLRILIVDDSRVILKSFGRILGKDYEVIEASNGMEALAILHEDDSICAVFTDMQMPKVNGLQLIQEIRAAKDSLLRSIPVILVTSADDEDEKVKQAFEEGVTEIIRKPFDSLLLQSTARAHVRSRSQVIDPDESATINQESKIANRAYFAERGEQEYAFARRHQIPLSVILLAVDNFKPLFYQYGEKSTKILAKTGQLIRAIMRQEDTVAHLGGAQFGLLMPATEVQDAVTLLERLQSEVVKKSISVDSHSISIRISAGVTHTLDDSLKDFRELLNQTNRYLSNASERGNTILTSLPSAQPQPSNDVMAHKVINLAIDKLLLQTHKRQRELNRDQAVDLTNKMIQVMEIINRTLSLNIETSLYDVKKALKDSRTRH